LTSPYFVRSTVALEPRYRGLPGIGGQVDWREHCRAGTSNWSPASSPWSVQKSSDDEYGYSMDQLDCYLDEFTFRFDRRTARSRGLLFDRLLHRAVATDPHPTANSPSAAVSTPFGRSVEAPAAALSATSGRGTAGR
jgi:hypothetical protein